MSKNKQKLLFYPDLSEFDNNLELKKELEYIRINITRLLYWIWSNSLMDYDNFIKDSFNWLRNNSNNCLLFSSKNEELIINFKKNFNEIVDLYNQSDKKVEDLKVEKIK